MQMFATFLSMQTTASITSLCDMDWDLKWQDIRSRTCLRFPPGTCLSGLLLKVWLTLDRQTALIALATERVVASEAQLAVVVLVAADVLHVRLQRVAPRLLAECGNVARQVGLGPLCVRCHGMCEARLWPGLVDEGVRALPAKREAHKGLQRDKTYRARAWPMLIYLALSRRSS